MSLLLGIFKQQFSFLMIVYYNNNFLPLNEINISPFDRGLLFSDGVYEALRTYNHKIFAFEEHIKRLEYSLNQISIPFTNLGELKNICLKLAELNYFKTDFGIYIQITRGISFPRKHQFNSDMIPNVFIYVYELADRRRELLEGVSVILEKDIRWERCDIKTISLLPAVLAKTKAVNKNSYESIFFCNDFITEGSHTNFFAVKNNRVITTPLGNYILSGVTRAVVLNLCKENDIYFNEEFINVDDLKNYDEFFITGTTTEITPVVKIDSRIVGNGKPGEMTKFLQDKFFALTKSFK